MVGTKFLKIVHKNGNFWKFYYIKNSFVLMKSFLENCIEVGNLFWNGAKESTFLSNCS